MGAQFRIDARIAPGMREARSAARFPVVIATTLRALGIRGRGAIVRDLSASGFMAETDLDFVPGETARIELPEVGVVSAQVIWATSGRVGGAFDRALAPAPLNRLIELGNAG